MTGTEAIITDTTIGVLEKSIAAGVILILFSVLIWLLQQHREERKEIVRTMQDQSEKYIGQFVHLNTITNENIRGVRELLIELKSNK